MTHPDGDIAFFNDAATGIAPTLKELVAYGKRLNIAFTAPGPYLASSGYARLETKDAVLLADMAPIGPDFLPGHAHADTLSFEFSLAGRRMLVNSGTSLYGTGEERQRQRASAAHNTVRLDGLDSSEVWHGFRVARRAHPINIQFTEECVAAGHDGYERLPGRPIHNRRWHLGPGILEIEDEVSGKLRHRIEFFLHIHPDWQIEALDSIRFRLFAPDSITADIELDPKLSWRVESSTWHPLFGVSVGNLRIVGDCSDYLPVRFTTRLTWSCAS